MNANPAAPGKLVSVQAGRVASYGFEGATDAHDEPWVTGIYKQPIAGSVFVGAMGVQGDGQADAKHHGGIDKAVLAYCADHYPKWREELNLPEMGGGAFGENLTIAGLDEESVCIGDIYRIGSVMFEASQPREACWKLARRWRMHELVTLVVGNGRSGWYLRVLQEGWIEPEMPVALTQRPNPGWTIARASRIMHHHPHDLAQAVALSEVPRLSAAWVHELRERAERLRATIV